MVYLPSFPVVAGFGAPAPGVRVTVAPVIGLPSLSLTVPLIVSAADAAVAGHATVIVRVLLLSVSATFFVPLPRFATEISLAAIALSNW